MKIKWTNKYSNEMGYVKSISKKEKHFVNTFDESEAKEYASIKTIENALKQLIEYGEDANNIFEII